MVRSSLRWSAHMPIGGPHASAWWHPLKIDASPKLRIFRKPSEAGSTTLNRGQAARAASTSHLGRLPRRLGISAGGTQKLNNSSTDQR